MTTSGATASSATAWTDAGLGVVTDDTANAKVFNPFGFDVSSVTVDTHDGSGGTVYATVMGFGTPHVYRSVDFGAHWLNVSANLQDAPANALVVDPNDANTVYVALDTGVYVTTQIATCATASCWSLMGTALPNAPVTGLATAANMLTGDGRRGMLRASTYGRGVWATPLLSATNLAQPAMTLSATNFVFGAQTVGTQSAAQTLTITSSGNAAVTIGSLVLTGDFVESDTCSGQTLAVGATCAVTLKFAPTATGTANGLLTVYANVIGGQATASLTGAGAAPAVVVLTPSSLTFAATMVGQTTAAQGIMVSNTGGTATPLSVAMVTGDFSVSASTCGATLAASAQCLLSVVFTPTASGVRNGTSSVTDDAGTQTAALTGTGTGPPAAAVVLTPGSLVFAATVVGQSAAAQTITVLNTGGTSTPLSVPVVIGDFQVSASTCGTTLAAQASCLLSVVFTPTASGARNGALSVTDDAGTQTASLTGAGTAPAALVLTPTALTFAATTVNQTTAAQIITVANTGGAATPLTAPVLTGDFSLSANTCGTTLAAQTACSLAVVFTPTASGVRNGTLSVSSTAGTQTASLTGTGLGPATDTLAPVSLTFATQLIGSSSAAQQVLLTNSGDVALTLVSAGISSGPFTVVSGCGVVVAAKSTCAFHVVFVPTATGAASGVLTVGDQFRSQTVLLSGTGVAPAGVSLTPVGGLVFGTLGVGLTSAVQVLTLTNNGGVALSISSMNVSGDFHLASTTCGATLGAGSACALSIVFAPTVGGARAGVVTLVDSAPSGTQTVQLSGVGIDFTLVATSATTMTVTSGGTAVYTLLLTAPARVSGTAAMDCTGRPSHGLCTVTPSQVTLNGATVVTVTVQTGLAAASITRPVFWEEPGVVVLALMLPALFLRRRRLPVVLMALVLTVSGCGAGRQIPAGGLQGPPTPTPSGSYNVLVSGSSAGISHSVGLTLVVQ